MNNHDFGDHILSVKDILKLLPVSRSTLWRMESRGEFPKRFKIGMRKVGWLESDVVSWLDNKREGNSQ